MCMKLPPDNSNRNSDNNNNGNNSNNSNSSSNINNTPKLLQDLITLLNNQTELDWPGSLMLQVSHKYSLHPFNLFNSLQKLRMKEVDFNGFSIQEVCNLSDSTSAPMPVLHNLILEKCTGVQSPTLTQFMKVVAKSIRELRLDELKGFTFSCLSRMEFLQRFSISKMQGVLNPVDLLPLAPVLEMVRWGSEFLVKTAG